MKPKPPRRRASAAVLAASFALFSLGCSDRVASSSTGGPPALADGVELLIGDRLLRAEIALDDSTRQRGLMYRESIPDDRGMLFIFSRRKPLSFWMRNTLVPLSIAFISDDGRILEIRHMRPKDESSTQSTHEVRYALEVPRGWFDRAGAEVGDTIPDFQRRVAPFLGRVR